VKIDGRTLFATAAVGAYAVDTRRTDRMVISVPVFCGYLVKWIAYETAPTWPSSNRIHTDVVHD
jgi:hypothetical protein